MAALRPTLFVTSPSRGMPSGKLRARCISPAPNTSSPSMEPSRSSEPRSTLQDPDEFRTDRTRLSCPSQSRRLSSMPRPKTAPLLLPTAPGESRPRRPCQWRPPSVAQGPCPQRVPSASRGTLRGDQGLLVGCRRQLIGANLLAKMLRAWLESRNV